MLASRPGWGLLHSHSTGVNQKGEDVFAFEAMVPFRQRRCEELFGKQWEQNYFFDSPHPTLIEAYVDRAKYHEALAAPGRSGRA